MLRKIFFSVIVLFFINQSAFANDTTKIVLKNHAPESYHGELFRLVGQFITNVHYRKFAIDDNLSSELYSNYIKHLDPLHLYFIESDINEFEKFKFALDDDLMMGNAKLVF
jgi:carboxyl-terminal processing protease